MTLANLERRPAAISERPAVKPDRSEGPVAQLGERLLCKQEVSGSIPLRSKVARHNEFVVL